MKTSTIDLNVSQIPGINPVAILQTRGELDRFTFCELINEARELYESGQRSLIIDMSEVQEVALSGFFALYSVAMLFRGEQPLDPEGGVVAFRMMAEYMHDAPHNIRLLKPQPHIQDALSTSGFPIYDDLAGAIASF